MRDRLKYLEATQADTPIWIQVGSLLKGSDSAPISQAGLVYNRDRILFVGGENETPSRKILKPGQNEPDAIFRDATLLPGLIDSHVHLFLEGGQLDFEVRKAYLTKAAEELLADGRERMKKLIAIGVMGMRDAGDKDGVGLALAAEYKTRRHHPIPYIDSPGPAIHHRGRYGSFMGAALEDEESLEACVEARVRAGADRIKLIPTGIINFEKGRVTAAPQMTAEEVGALVRAAKSHGRQTFAHASGSEGVEIALEGGVDSVEHAYFITPDQLARMRDDNIAWVPTFTPLQVQVEQADRMGWSPETVGHLERILEAHAESLFRAHTLGVRVIAGSDAGSCGVAHGLGFLAELECMAKAGLPTRKVLHTATGAAADRLGFHETIGQIIPGAKPRMILTRHSPLEDISHLRKEKICLFDGEVFFSPSDPPGKGL